MTRHLTRQDYIEMPWANGLGSTIEIMRHPSQGSDFLWRFSLATVAQDGPFSQFPQIERNLTVISGPGFDLLGEGTYRADPLQPVAFPGDIALAARNVTGTAVDFNVMTRRSLPLPKVDVIANAQVTAAAGATLCLFALGGANCGTFTLAPHDFLWSAPNGAISGAPVLAIQLFTNPL